MLHSLALGVAVIFQPAELGGGEEHGGELAHGLVEGVAHFFLNGCAFEGGAEVHIGADEEFAVVVVEEDDAVSLAGDGDCGDFGGGGVGLGEGTGYEISCGFEGLLGVEFAGEFGFAVGDGVVDGGVAVGQRKTFGVGDHAVESAGTEVQSQEISGQGFSTLGGLPGLQAFHPSGDVGCRRGPFRSGAGRCLRWHRRREG